MRRLNFGLLLGLCVCLGVKYVYAEATLDLSPIVVTATRIPQGSADIPASIDRLDAPTIQNGQLQVNLSESLMAVPGVSAQNRQNYAQDLQISVRGFGARSSFGVRGVRLYSDGIPGTMPDGQGQFSQFDLGSADHIEVLRGPFSALYGNSSGGVISIFTADALPGYMIGGTAEYGTFNTQRYALQATGITGPLNYVFDVAHFQTGGYRNHSSAERNNLNGKLKFSLTESQSLSLILNAVQTPFVQDPLGLTNAELHADPRQAGDNSVAFNTRKALRQEQLGLTYENVFRANDTFSATAYTGHRETTQFQAIPVATQTNPLYPGGVIDLDRSYYGIDTHVTDKRSFGATDLQLTAGLSYDDLEEARKGYLNYIGTDLGVEGGLRRDEANHVYDFDQYLQAQWDPAARWRFTAGLRNSRVDVSSHGHLAGAPPPSSVSYSATNPVAGVTFRLAPAANLYASYGRGFETPTLNDIAYRSTDGSLPGLNLGLKPARSNNYEVGLKAGNGMLRGTLAGFYIRTEDEIAILANTNGRTVNQNIGETTRRGMELALDAVFSGGFSARLAYTYIRAVVGQSYQTCVGAPCRLPVVCAAGAVGCTPVAGLGTLVTVPSGNYLPAVPMNSLYTGLTWTYPRFGFSTTLEEQARARIYADDRNSNATHAYWLTNWRAGFEQQSKHWRFTEYARVDNLMNRAYVGSVIVNESNSRYFEPEPGRIGYIMFTASHRE